VQAIRLLLVSLLLAVSVAACGFGMQAGVLQSSSCGNLPTGACQEQLDQLVLRHPSARQIDIECGAAQCTRAFGAGTARITEADGTLATESWSYAGDPGPVPAPVCAGTAGASCRAIAASVVADVAPSKRVVAIAIRCRVARCDEHKGDAEVTITLADGTSQVTGFGWDGGLP
jgi:hypothetical protein